jgi:hypothetical protein
MPGYLNNQWMPHKFLFFAADALLKACKQGANWYIIEKNDYQRKEGTAIYESLC